MICWMINKVVFGVLCTMSYSTEFRRVSKFQILLLNYLLVYGATVKFNYIEHTLIHDMSCHVILFEYMPNCTNFLTPSDSKIHRVIIVG